MGLCNLMTQCVRQLALWWYYLWLSSKQSKCGSKIRRVLSLGRLQKETGCDISVVCLAHVVSCSCGHCVETCIIVPVESWSIMCSTLAAFLALFALTVTASPLCDDGDEVCIRNEASVQVSDKWFVIYNDDNIANTSISTEVREARENGQNTS